jgi:hypothetical protein
MVNHLRTCLLNVNGSLSPSPAYPGEEYVPPTYVAKFLPGELAQGYELLFGLQPDRALMNYNLRALLDMLHASELESHVLALDPRITYMPPKTDLFDLVASGAVITQLAGTQTLTFAGGNAVSQVGNNISFRWQVAVLDSSHVQVTQYSNTFTSAVTTILPYTVSNGLSCPIALPGSSLSVHFTAGTGSSWQIDAMARPALDIPALSYGLSTSLTADMADAIFGPVGSPEPYKTFRNLWEMHDQLPYRLGGLVLALGYQIDSLKK